MQRAPEAQRGAGSPAAAQQPSMSTGPQRVPIPLFRACRIPYQTACTLYAFWVSPQSPGHGQGSPSPEEGDSPPLGSFNVASDPEFHREASNLSSSPDPCPTHHGPWIRPLSFQVPPRHVGSGQYPWSVPLPCQGPQVVGGATG